MVGIYAKAVTDIGDIRIYASCATREDFVIAIAPSLLIRDFTMPSPSVKITAPGFYLSPVMILQNWLASSIISLLSAIRSRPVILCPFPIR